MMQPDPPTATYMPLPFLARLGLDLNADERAIRRAYARALKEIDQETDLEGFQALRESYQAALAWHAQRRPETAMPRSSSDSKEDAPHSRNSSDAHIDTGNTPSRKADPAYSARTIDHARQIAHALLADLRKKLAAGWPQDRTAASIWLNEVLKDQRLIDMDARHFFEWGMAALLAEGWQPRKEFLFGPAIDCFGWKQDRGRLAAFGHAGAVVASAIGELEFFDTRPKHVRVAQKELIQGLRESSKPPTSTLLKHRATLRDVVQHYPHWLHIITDTRNAKRWLEWADQIPRWRQRLALSASSSTSERKGGNFWFGWIFLLVLVLSTLGKISALVNSSGPSVPRHSPPLTTQSFAPSAAATDGTASSFTRIVKDLPASSAAPVPLPLDDDSLKLPPAAELPRHLQAPRLAYPEQAKRLRQEGRVVIKARIDPDGKIRRAEIDQSSSHAILDEAAMAAVLKASFIAAKDSSGASVPSVIKIPIKFELGN
ncbi:energy transducer TonB [Delftia acidovorans]|uniref:energy transducer TonB n=1 Tax=Delftia acidovorans TaxID=80866 RepID=UPI00160718B6|nr:energy transducer TonB [Delftia acidovorans]